MAGVQALFSSEWLSESQQCMTSSKASSINHGTGARGAIAV